MRKNQQFNIIKTSNMKKLICLFLFIHIIIISYSQMAPLSTLVDRPCDMCTELVKNGLEETYNIRKGNHFFQDAKTYFSSDKFIEDYENGSWKGDISLVVEGAPVSLGAGSSKEEVRKFQEKIRNSTSIQTTSTFFETVSRSTKNTDLARIYLECLIKICTEDSQKDGIDGVVSNTENTATFIITYRDKFGQSARVQSFEIRSGGRVINSYTNGYRVGNTLQPERIVTSQRNPNLDLVLTIQTTRGTKSLVVESETNKAAKSNKVPIGTIVCSYLTFEQFNAVTNNNEKSPYKTWSDAFSFWAPCDGRNIQMSELAKIVRSTTSVPDLRGVFLRGLNTFDPSESTIVSEKQANPEVKVVGELQEDALQNHKHNDEGHTHNSNAVTGGGIRSDNANDRDVMSSPTPATNPVGKANLSGAVKLDANSGEVRVSKETRPKNVSVYYYIRIN